MIFLNITGSNVHCLIFIIPILGLHDYRASRVCEFIIQFIIQRCFRVIQRSTVKEFSFLLHQHADVLEGIQNMSLYCIRQRFCRVYLKN